MIPTRYVLLFALSFFSLLSNATPPIDSTDLPIINYEKYRLKNGLEVILVEDHRLPLVAVNTWYHVGAGNEEPGRTGFAHLFEHMMFAGSKHVPRGVADSLLEGSGADSSNGSTSFDQTNYFETVPSNQLALDLWIHADRMGYLLDVLDQTALTNQKDVVRNERRQSYENRPYGIVEEALWHNLFPNTHPYHADVMGSHADIQAASLEDIKKFFKVYYRPNNATLVIVGDIDKAKTKRLVKKYYGSLQRGPIIEPYRVVAPVITAEKRVVVPDHVQLDRVIMGWHTPKIFTPGDAELSLAGQVLGGGKSSRLYRTLVYEKQIAQEVSAYQYSLQLGSVFFVDVTARPGHTAAEIEAAIDDELKKLRTTPIEANELERAQNSVETNMIAGLEKLGGVAELLNQYNHYTGNPGYFIEEIKAYRRLTPERIQQAVDQYLQPSARVVITGIPGQPNAGPDVPAATHAAPAGAGAETVNRAEPWRSHIPKAGKQRPLILPKGESFKLANGLTVIHHYKPGLPVVSAYLAFKSGSDANPIDKPGLAGFTADLLDEGTTTRSSAQIADEIARLGASLSTGASLDASAIELFSLKKNFVESLGIMADVALNPSFVNKEIERQRASRLGDLVQIRENASAIAATTSAAALYGFAHQYGYPVIGTESAIKAVSRTDLVAYWEHYYIPNNAALIVSGDITRDELTALAESLFGKWQARSLDANNRATKLETTAAKLVIVDKPGASQTALRVTTMGPNRNTPDFAALEVANAALGGLFTSRINTKLREEKGYTYGVHSDFRYRRTAGPFEIRTDVRTEVTGPAVEEIFAELRNLEKHPIKGPELQKARDSQLLSLPGAFETGLRIAHTLADTFIYDLGLDYYTRLPTELRRVDAKAVAAVVDKYLQPEQMIVIGVGDKEKIEPGLMKLKLQPVEYRDVEGKVVAPGR
ncbi:MAG: pitrilysin family protein [Pseudomonadota bacterium]